MDNYMSEAEYKAELEKIKAENESIKRKQLLQQEREKGKPKKKKMANSKKAMWLIIAIMIEVIAFSEFVIIYLKDTGSLVAIIGIASAALGFVFNAYVGLSKIENSANGIVYETAMATLNLQPTTTTPTPTTLVTTPIVTTIETEDEQDNQEDNGL